MSIDHRDCSTTSAAEQLALVAARAADDMQGTDIVVLDVADIVGVCEMFVICTARNTRLVAAIADEIEVHVAIEYDRRPVAVEGLAERRWVLLDYGDVVVHVFVQEEREFYRIERLYRDADSVEWREVAAPAT